MEELAKYLLGLWTASTTAPHMSPRNAESKNLLCIALAWDRLLETDRQTDTVVLIHRLCF